MTLLCLHTQTPTTEPKITPGFTEHSFPIGIFISVYFICIYGKVELNNFPLKILLRQTCSFLRPFTWVIIFSSIDFKRPESGHNILFTFTWWTHIFFFFSGKIVLSQGFLMECDFSAPLKLVSLPVSLKKSIFWVTLTNTAPSFLMCD